MFELIQKYESNLSFLSKHYTQISLHFSSHEFFIIQNGSSINFEVISELKLKIQL